VFVPRGQRAVMTMTRLQAITEHATQEGVANWNVVLLALV
jgi:hypothetical protein